MVVQTTGLYGPQCQQEPDINPAASGLQIKISPTGLAITSDSGGNKAFHTGLFLTTLPSSDPALSAHGPLHLTLFHFPILYLLTMVVS